MRATVDGNEAAASVAYRLQRGLLHLPDHAVLADGRAGRRVVEPGAAQRLGHACRRWWRCRARAARPGALHGALQGGALATTFTASQGLLLMIPNMYKIAGELTAAVMHVAARSLAAQGLSIFGDHSDVMAVRQTGFALLASASVQEAHDLALVAQAATLADAGAVRALLRRLPHLARAEHDRAARPTTTCGRCVPEELVRAHRARALSPGAAVHPRHRAEPRRLLPGARDRQPVLRARPRSVVQDAMDQLGERTGRHYGLVDYSGHPEAERVLVVMGSGGETARETVALPAGARRAGRRRAGPAVPAVPGAGARRRRCPRPCGASRCSTAPRSRARSASRCSSTCSRRSARPTPTASAS